MRSMPWAGELANEQGVSIVEAIVATMLVTVAVVSGAQLLARARQANQRATTISVATILAQQKIEQLRALAWGVDSSGIAVSDLASDLSASPERPSGGQGLSTSPTTALLENTAGYCDFLDQYARSLGGGIAPPPGTMFVRRWSILPSAEYSNTLVLQVLVMRWRNIATGALEIADPGGRRLPDEARLITLKTRKVP